MARVIRGAKVVPAEVVEAEARAAEILEAARRDAEAERAAMRAELAAEAEATARAQLASALIGVETARDAAVAEARASALAIATAVARRIVGDALAAEPERVRAMVERATARVARARRTTVRVHPDDLALVESLPATCVADASLTRGDCVVESDLGDVDGRVETQIARLLAALGGAGA
ncbi:MAG: FliH/SctL family protein [Sandaracinaceae bacterium]